MVEHSTKAKLNYKPARLVDGSGKWYIVWYAYNASTKKKERQRFYIPEEFKTVTEKRVFAKEFIAEVNTYLASGYSTNVKDQNVIKLGVSKVITDTTNGIDFETYTLTEAIEFAIKKKEFFVKIKDYKTFKNTFFLWLSECGQEKLMLSSLTEQLVIDFFDYLEEVREVAPKTFNNYHTNFHALMEVLVDRKLIPANPTKIIKKRRCKSGGHFPFTIEQMTKILNELKKSGENQMLLFVYFLFYTCARPKIEVANLKIGDINKDTIRFISEYAKNSKTDYTEISHPFEEIITEYKLREYPKNFYIFGKGGEPGVERVSRDHFYKKQKKLLKRLGFIDEKYDLYCYKHTAVCLLLESGGTLVEVQRLCRHSNIQQTAIYARNLGKITKSPLRDLYPKLN